MEGGSNRQEDEDRPFFDARRSSIYRKTAVPTRSVLFDWCKNPQGLHCVTASDEHYVPLRNMEGETDRFAQKEYSHLIYGGYCGGKLYIPDNALDTFLECYLHDIKSGVEHSISEQRSEVFKMHADIDLTDDHFLTDDEIHAWVAFYQQEIALFFPAEDMLPEHRQRVFEVYVLRAPAKGRVLDDIKYVVTGVHLVWPHLHVNAQRALYLRQAFLERLYKEYGPRTVGHSWEVIVDANIYIKNGLRMPYSIKVLDKCPYCERRKGCLYCDGERMSELRAYKPVSVLGIDGMPLSVDLQDKSLEMAILRNTTIRLHDGAPMTEPFEIYEGAPKPQLESKPKSSPKNHTIVPLGSPQYRVALALIHGYDSEHYSLLSIGNMWCNQKVTQYTIHVRGRGMYCNNIRGYHNSAAIFFVIDQRGLMQRCFCKCKTNQGRQNGFCSTYESPASPLTSEDSGCFFAASSGLDLMKRTLYTGDKMTQVHLIRAHFCLQPDLYQEERPQKSSQHSKRNSKSSPADVFMREVGRSRVQKRRATHPPNDSKGELGPGEEA